MELTTQAASEKVDVPKMWANKTALENIDATIDKAAESLAKCTSAASMIEFGQALEALYRLRVEEQARIKKRSL
jgi:hypothetical protein